MKKALKIVGITVAGLVSLLVGALVVLVALADDDFLDV